MEEKRKSKSMRMLILHRARKLETIIILTPLKKEETSAVALLLERSSGYTGNIAAGYLVCDERAALRHASKNTRRKILAFSSH